MMSRTRMAVLIALAGSCLLTLAVVATGALFFIARNTYQGGGTGIDGEAFFKSDGSKPEELSGLLVEVYAAGEYEFWKQKEEERGNALKVMRADVSARRAVLQQCEQQRSQAESERDSRGDALAALQRQEISLKTELEHLAADLREIDRHEAYLNQKKNDKYSFTDPIQRRQVVLSWHKKEDMQKHFETSRRLCTTRTEVARARHKEAVAAIPQAKQEASNARTGALRAVMEFSQAKDALDKATNRLRQSELAGPSQPTVTRRITQTPVRLNGSFSMDLEPGDYWVFAIHQSKHGLHFYWSEVACVTAGKRTLVQLHNKNATVYRNPG